MVAGFKFNIYPFVKNINRVAKNFAIPIFMFVCK